MKRIAKLLGLSFLSLVTILLLCCFVDNRSLNIVALRVIALSDTAASKIVLAHQYQLLAEQSRAQALQLFQAGVSQYQTQLLTAEGPARANLEYLLGLSYQCAPEQNFEQAAYWYNRARDSGNPSAAEALEKLTTDPQCRPAPEYNFAPIEFNDS